jgi:mycofactocin system glycosyltransferase
VAERWRSDDLPAAAVLVLDPGTRRVDGGRALIGGSPLRILRLSEVGTRAVDAWEGGAAVGEASGRRHLARRLLDGGLAHPRFEAGPYGPSDVTVIVAVHDDPELLGVTLAALHAPGAEPPGAVLVADDATPDAVGIRRVADRYGATVVRRDVRGGPASGRNTALAQVRTPVVAFVDRDVVPEAGWLPLLLAHLADPRVAGVAPRIRAASGRADDALAAFDHDRSPLDLGPAEGRVAPGTRVAYVPTTALLVRRSLFDEIGAFDEALPMGEDVDLIWRTVDAGYVVRYEPRAVARHPTRRDLRAWLRQRFDYGTSAAPLDARHPGSVAPLTLSGWTAAAWALAAVGHPVVGAAVAAGAASLLPRRLTMLDDPWRETWQLAGKGQIAAWRPIATAVTRTWWPVALGAAVVSRRARRAVVLAAVVPPLVDWANGDRALDPVRYTGLRILDDVAYGAGVWTGCVRGRTLSPLLPRLRSWPGRRPAVEAVGRASGSAGTTDDATSGAAGVGHGTERGA